MKKVINLIISSKTTLVLLLIFTIAIASATFVEDIHDTATAKFYIYNAKWFEFLLLLLVLNFIGSIKRYHLLRKNKLAGFLFHFAFIVIIIGAGVTRYIGYEGSMHIRQGESSNFIYSSEIFLNISAVQNDYKYSFSEPMAFGKNMKKSFNLNLDIEDDNFININFKDYLKNAKEIFKEVENENGVSVVELTINVQGHKDVLYIKDGELKETHGFFVAYNNDERNDVVKIINQEGKLFISYPKPIKMTKMPEKIVNNIAKDTFFELKSKHLYEPEGSDIGLILSKYYKNAKIKYVEGESDGPDALIFDVTYNGKTQEAIVLGGQGYVDNYQRVILDGVDLQISYGTKKIELPFTLRLNEFILERYAGSESPSSYASEVTLIDRNKGFTENYRIFMNNVLNYGGYRFFQSSYDKDEKGTILSVNQDFYGTWISYFGYFLLTLGFILTLFNKNSRYRDLIQKINNKRAKRKELVSLLLFAFLSIGNSFSQDVKTNHLHETNPSSVSSQHAEKFGHLIVQTYEGRFKPVNTLAYDVMHKISKKDKFDIPGKGKMDAMQVFMDLPLNAVFWKQQKLIYVREKHIMSLINAEGKYASFNDFFNEDGSYKLSTVAETAFRKSAAEQNALDKEIIKLNEKVEIFMMAFQGNLFKIFPLQGSSNNKWIQWNDPLAKTPLKGAIKMLNQELNLKEFNYHSLMMLYLTEVFNAARSGDYSRSNTILGYIENIQRQNTTANLLPSKSKVRTEIHYNKSKIFINLKNIYALLSIVLLVLAFIDNLKSKKNKIVTILLNISIGILAISFLYHTYGMGLRWYLAGHAPWSNGFEALVLIAWASLLAGFSFIRYSKITLAATALLAFFTLMTASHSSYDPQLTNLVPVLKSYWLIIHVAILTVSYGFLGLGFILGIINLCMYLIKNVKNYKKIDLIIAELTYINELNLTIGLFLATVGTFLGGIWANESWGRYWGWDAKETWALVIVIAYSIVLHFRLVPKMRSLYIFNVGAIVSFFTVLMTFFGVNYYLSKGMHSYASGDTPVFPLWAWIALISLLIIIIAAGLKERYTKIDSRH
tara:strand:- start:3025 stop:6207 length:3183 start_codon:yes stop_codon:yes gene_type:complete